MDMPCLEWLGARSAYGYGQVWDSATKKVEYTHRRAWKFSNGPIPEKYVVAHFCDNPPCCEPTHLFLTTKAGNSQDMQRKGRSYNQNTFKTECKNGHQFTDANTYYYNRSRVCRTCHRESERARRSRAGS